MYYKENFIIIIVYLVGYFSLSEYFFRFLMQIMPANVIIHSTQSSYEHYLFIPQPSPNTPVAFSVLT